jgi:hypothetical protein
LEAVATSPNPELVSVDGPATVVLVVLDGVRWQEIV